VRTILNILWLVLSGLWFAIGYALAVSSELLFSVAGRYVWTESP
jgi:uncharacterized membrane protein YccF (DUF307 family)